MHLVTFYCYTHSSLSTVSQSVSHLFSLHSSVLYYMTRDGKSDKSISLRKYSLRNAGMSEELFVNVTQVRKVTFDAEAQEFYWIRQSTDTEAGLGIEGDVIEKYFVSNSSTMLVATRASNVEGAFVHWSGRLGWIGLGWKRKDLAWNNNVGVEMIPLCLLAMIKWWENRRQVRSNA